MNECLKTWLENAEAATTCSKYTERPITTGRAGQKDRSTTPPATTDAKRGSPCGRSQVPPAGRAAGLAPGLLGLVPGVCVLGVYHQVHQQGLGGEAREGGAHAGHHARARRLCRLPWALQNHLVVHLAAQRGEERQAGRRGIERDGHPVQTAGRRASRRAVRPATRGPPLVAPRPARPTCSSRRQPISRSSGSAAMRSMAAVAMSAAEPWMGVLMAARSAWPCTEGHGAALASCMPISATVASTHLLHGDCTCQQQPVHGAAQLLAGVPACSPGRPCCASCARLAAGGGGPGWWSHSPW